MNDEELVEILTSRERWRSIYEIGAVLGMSQRGADTRLTLLEASGAVTIELNIVFPTNLNPKVAAEIAPSLKIEKVV